MSLYNRPPSLSLSELLLLLLLRPRRNQEAAGSKKSLGRAGLGPHPAGTAPAPPATPQTPSQSRHPQEWGRECKGIIKSGRNGARGMAGKQRCQGQLPVPDQASPGPNPAVGRSRRMGSGWNSGGLEKQLFLQVPGPPGSQQGTGPYPTEWEQGPHPTECEQGPHLMEKV